MVFHVNPVQIIAAGSVRTGMKIPCAQCAKELIQIAEYFRTPLATAVTGGDRISNSESPIPGGGDDYTQSQGEVNKQPNIEELKKRMEQSRLRKLRGDLDQLIESDPKLRALRPHLKIDLVQEGLRIQIIDSQNRPMFRTGSADVEPYMRDILRAIAPVLNGIPNRISLSGHTDDFPYASGEKGYSNWELSADRANASRRELMVGGLDSGKVLRVVGMAATMRLSDRGPDDAVNRRIRKRNMLINLKNVFFCNSALIRHLPVEKSRFRTRYSKFVAEKTSLKTAGFPGSRLATRWKFWARRGFAGCCKTIYAQDWAR